MRGNIVVLKMMVVQMWLKLRLLGLLRLCGVPSLQRP
jgi:hypothetical protein